MLWRTGIVLAFIAGAAMLAYQIGSRLSDQAVMTIAGVACGIVASIPVSLGLLIALTRERTTYAVEEYEDAEPEPVSYPIYRPAAPAQMYAQPHAQQPQIIVVAPPNQQLPQGYSPYANYFAPGQPNALPAPMQERTFKIVGEETLDD